MKPDTEDQTITTKTKTIKKTGVKAGGIAANHNQGMAVRSKVKAGALTGNHNQSTAASR